MPEIIDYPPPRRPRRLLVTFAVLAAVLFALFRGLDYYVSGLWFGSLGYLGVFRRMLGLQWGIFAVFAAGTFALLFGSFLFLQNDRFGTIAGSRALIVNGQPITIDFRRYLRPAALLGSLFLAYVAGSATMDDWPVFARMLYAPGGAGGPLDPVLGRPVSFYLLTLPTWQLVSGWLLLMSLLVLGMSVLLFVLRGREPLTVFHHVNPEVPRYRSVAAALGLLMLALAWRAYLSRFDLLLTDHTIFSGVTFVDAHVMLPGLLLVCLVCVLGAGVAVYSAVAGRTGARWLAAAILPAVLLFLGLQLVAVAVSAFLVKPNELVKETPLIAKNIEFTRQAYALDAIQLRSFAAQTTVASADAAGNQATLQNIRLWDWRALQDTLRQIQEIRTYYDFPGIDIDRYNIGGTAQEVMLATRELSLDKLPESSRNWINEKLIYTHGYGITMNPVNGFTPEGLPKLLLSNMPVQSTVPSLEVKRPEVYFGELTDTDVYVRTRQKEFDYPQGQTNSVTSYHGTGGIVLGSWLHRTLIALDRGDLAKLPFSDDVTTDSRLLMRRNIRERVQAIAPFLTLDPDPYIVLGDDGRLSWMMDAYTTSDTYPEARHYAAGDGDVNYMRNSVKVVVDAYDGSTSFYVFDAKDPVLAAYRNAFPTLFRDASAMPPGLRKHVRYPDLLLTLQAHAYSLYHMTEPETFFNREDLWTPATESGVDTNGERSTNEMEPNFVLMKLPDEGGVEFVNILPFTPSNRNNLIGWIAGRSDGAHYGSAVVYSFPKTRLVDGPLQVEARIDQNAQISGQLTLWNQQGSHVRRGNLLVIPIGSALLYSESIYLQAERSPMPELRLVVLALQDRLAYGTSFEAAMASLFGGAESSVSAPSTATGASAATSDVSPSPASTVAGEPGRAGLIRDAARDLADYQRLTAEGKLADAGSKLEQLKRAIDEMQKAPR